jgi:hypothetical protein
MKLDKETVIKHQFWFLLGSYLLIWFIAVLWLKFTAPDAITNAKNNYKKAADGVKAESASPVNKATFLPPWEKEADTFDKHKSVIWKQAWLFQAGMYDWPDYLVKNYDMSNPQTVISTDDLNRYRHDLYPQQIENLRVNAPRWLEPVELLSGFDNIFKPKAKAEWHETPTREEMWLAQEDFWVKREVFVVVWDAMLRQAFMQEVKEIPEPNPDPEHIKARYRFHNKNWEITLHIRTNDKGLPVIGGDSTIKNIHPSGHPQPLTSGKGRGVTFNVVQDRVRTSFEVRGEPISNGEVRPFSMEKDQERKDSEPLNGINWDKDKAKEHPIYVSQGFDATNSPIRRINAIELGQQDCRTFIWPLQPNNALAELDAVPEENKPPESAQPAGGGMGGNPQEMMMKNQQQMQQQMMGGGMMGGRSGGQGANSGNPTPNNQFERNRYLQPTSQDKKLNPPSRHLPMAIQFIVEQSHMHDVLLALANSRLRFQITQAEFRHVKDYTPQSDSEKKGENKELAGMGGTFMGPAAPGMGGGVQNQMIAQMQKQRQMMMQQGGGMMGGPGGMMQMQMQQRARQMQQMRGGMMGGGGAPPGSFGPMMMQSPMAGAGGAGKGQPFAFGMRGGGPFPGAGGAIDPKQAAQNQQDDNLVELTVYGIATLYRFPDQPKPTEQPNGQSATPASEPAPQQPGTTTAPNTAAQPNAAAPTTQTGGAPQPGAVTPLSGTPPPAEPKQADKDKAAPEPKQNDKADGKQPPAPTPPKPPTDGKR